MKAELNMNIDIATVEVVEISSNSRDSPLFQGSITWTIILFLELPIRLNLFFM